MSSRSSDPVQRAAAGVGAALGQVLRSKPQGPPARGAHRLAQAVYQEDLDALRAALEEGLPADAPVPDRPFTPLMVACGRDFLEGVRLLLAHGAEVNRLVPGYGSPLTFALSSDTRRAVPVLLEAGADPSLSPEGISAPLVFAATARDEATARLLLDHGASLEAQDTQGWSLLAIALAEHLDDLALELIRRGARPDHREPDGTTPLSMALDGLLEPLALAMLEAPGLDPQALRLSDGRGLLDLAAAGGLVAAGRRLLALGEPVDGPTDQAVPPLHRALIYGQPAFADLLLEHGASLASRPQAPLLRVAAFVGHLGSLERGRAQALDVLAPELLEAAALGGSVPALAWFQQQGADLVAVPPEPCLPPLHAAALRGRLEAVRWLLDQGVPVDLKDGAGRTPLRLALEEDLVPDLPGVEPLGREPLPPGARIGVVDGLIQAGTDLTREAAADPQLVTRLLDFGRTEVVLALLERGLPVPNPAEAVYTATFRREPQVLAELLRRGHPCTWTSPRDGDTCLHAAATMNHPDHLDLLLEAGLPLEALNAHRVTPLLRACREGAREATERLLARGANPNHQDLDGWSPLMAAAEERLAGLVQLLLKHGAKRGLKNREGATALTYARKARRKDLMKLLD